MTDHPKSAEPVCDVCAHGHLAGRSCDASMLVDVNMQPDPSGGRRVTCGCVRFDWPADQPTVERSEEPPWWCSGCNKSVPASEVRGYGAEVHVPCGTYVDSQPPDEPSVERSEERIVGPAIREPG